MIRPKFHANRTAGKKNDGGNLAGGEGIWQVNKEQYELKLKARWFCGDQ